MRKVRKVNAHRGAMWVAAFVSAATIIATAGTAAAEGAAELEREAIASLERLYQSTPAARKLGNEAVGILVFPQVGKAGFIFAAEFGVGALRREGRTAGFYNIAEVSAGYQVGVEKFSYALFFMTDKALEYLDRSGGFEVGAGPTLVVADEGFAKTMTTTTLRSDVYAFSFGQAGLMGGVGLKGSKITRYHPSE